MKFVRVRAGLLEPKHVAALGGAVWLYLWLHTRVQWRGEGAGTTFPAEPYRHRDAAAALGVKEGTIRDWFRALKGDPTADPPTPGYITVRQRKTGLEVTITKYVAPSEGVENPTPSAIEGVEISTQGCGNPNTLGVEISTPSERPTRSAREKPTTRVFTREIQERGAPAALRPHQAVVNAWLEATGRDPTQARDYGRYVAVGAEMATRGDTPQDVRSCTRYLQSDPWRKERSKQPTLQQVMEALPLWVEQGRPATVRVGQNGRARPPSVAATAMEGISDALGIGRDDLEAALAGRPAGGGGGGAPRRAVRPGAVGQELPRQLRG